MKQGLSLTDGANRKGTVKITESLVKHTTTETPVDSKKQSPGERDTTQAPSPKRQVSMGPADVRADGRRAGEPKQRRLTAFQLLQAKFMKTTSKHSSHQRQVGALHCDPRGRGACETQDRPAAVCGPETHQPKPKQRKKTGNNVKDMVARFARAEEKEKGENIQGKLPIKARLIRKGPLLTSLMERFETLSTMQRTGDLISPLDKSPRGVGRRTGCARDNVSGPEKAQQTNFEEGGGGGLKHRPTAGETIQHLLPEEHKQEEETEGPGAMLRQQNSVQREQNHSEPTQRKNLCPDQKFTQVSNESETGKLLNSKPEHKMDQEVNLNGAEELCSKTGDIEQGGPTPNCLLSSVIEGSLLEALELAAQEEGLLGCYSVAPLSVSLAFSEPSPQPYSGRTKLPALDFSLEPHPEAIPFLTKECYSGVPLRSSHTGETPQEPTEDEDEKLRCCTSKERSLNLGIPLQHEQRLQRHLIPRAIDLEGAKDTASQSLKPASFPDEICPVVDASTTCFGSGLTPGLPEHLHLGLHSQVATISQPTKRGVDGQLERGQENDLERGEREMGSELERRERDIVNTLEKGERDLEYQSERGERAMGAELERGDIGLENQSEIGEREMEIELDRKGKYIDNELGREVGSQLQRGERDMKYQLERGEREMERVGREIDNTLEREKASGLEGGERDIDNELEREKVERGVREKLMQGINSEKYCLELPISGTIGVTNDSNAGRGLANHSHAGPGPANHSHAGPESPPHIQKYRTINYADPSAQLIFKPKVIRFTDTFTF